VSDALDVTAIITGIGAIVTTCFGVRYAVREARRKERKQSATELDELGGMLADCRDHDLIARSYAHTLETTMADQGLPRPERPW
jgi:DNA gyrase/topoisomerase IV subunit B